MADLQTALDKGEAEVALKLTLGGKTTTLSKKVKIEKKGIIDVSFEQELKLAEDATKQGAPTAMAERLNQIATAYPADETVGEMVKFLRSTSEGLFGRFRERQRPDSRRQGQAQ